MRDKPFGFYFLLFIIILLFFKFYQIIYTFLPAIATGLVLAYLSQPIYWFFYMRTRKETLSAFAVLLINFALIGVPAFIIALAVQNQVQYILTIDILAYARNAVATIDTFMTDQLNIPMIEQYVNELIFPLLTAGQETLRRLIPSILLSMTQLIISAFIAFFIMYYSLTNSKQIIEMVRFYGPLNDENMTILLREMGNDTKTLILGQLLIAVLQGTLAGIGFFLFGVPTAILWALVTVLASFMPVVGAGLVWVPATLYLFMSGQQYPALGLLLWGVLVVSTSDNLVRPKLVSILGSIHPVTVLLGVFIGIKEWGLIGLVLGPLLISVLIHLIRMFREQFLSEVP